MSDDSINQLVEKFIRDVQGPSGPRLWKDVLTKAPDLVRNHTLDAVRGAFAWFMKQPIDLLLHCPFCGQQHIDEASPDVCETCGLGASACPCSSFTAWLNPPHRSHRCSFCNYVWRPADVPTNGVAEIKTKGERDQNPTPALASLLGRFVNVVLRDGPELCPMYPLPCLALTKDGEDMRCIYCQVEAARKEMTRCQEKETEAQSS